MLLNLDSGQYYGLDEVGGRIWSLLTADGRLESVHDRIVDEYEVGREEAEKDILRLVGELNEHGLVEIRRPQDRSENRESGARDEFVNRADGPGNRRTAGYSGEFSGFGEHLQRRC